MNIAFYLTPKGATTYAYSDMTVAQVIEILQRKRHTAIPVLNPDGTFHSVISEGDILWYLSENGRMREDADIDHTLISQIPHFRDYKPVKISANVDSLYEAACVQSFVPVEDDNGIFIGIIRRRDIVSSFYKEASKKKQEEFL